MPRGARKGGCRLAVHDRARRGTSSSPSHDHLTRVPEQPEVEHAVRRLRAALVGRRLRQATPLHPALARRLPADDAASLAGRTVVAVERRGKHQLLHLDDGRALHVHFRMAGDWVLDHDDAPLPPHARLVLACDDGTRVVLADPRALATAVLLASDAALPALGPEAADPALTPAVLRAALSHRRGPIKPVLLDQRVVAGVGNIYAAEALWRARISPRAVAATLSAARVARLLDGIRDALAAGARAATRYRAGDDALAVYGREGEPCARCGAPIRRVVQAGRATYFCPRCQRR
jgi:formamidopyrimidine-DNA glycosylase